jgi:hypothetical protein
MSEPVYNVVFRGEIAQERTVSEVKSRLTALLKLDLAAVDRLFSGQAQTVKKHVDYPTALRYVRAFGRAGALCRLQTVSSGNSGLPPLRSHQAEHDAPDGQEQTTTCPRCGQQQQSSEECSRCGIIFSKVLERTAGRVAESGRAPSISFYDSIKEKKLITQLIAVLVLLAAMLIHSFTTGEIKHPPGILVNSEPKQVMIKNPNAWQLGNRVVVPLAHFSLTARVLSKERYRFDAVADLSPIDLALGWGLMSDQRVLDELEIAQGHRYYVLAPNKERTSLPMATLLACSSNMHMIPANGEIRKRLLAVRQGGLISLSGYLVGVQQDGRWIWFSSLSRTDSGNGACEIVWVEDVVIH